VLRFNDFLRVLIATSLQLCAYMLPQYVVLNPSSLRLKVPAINVKSWVCLKLWDIVIIS
jgi:hypothetical protein